MAGNRRIVSRARFIRYEGIEEKFGAKMNVVKRVNRAKGKRKKLFKCISGQVEILGLFPNNDEHLFLIIKSKPKSQRRKCV